MVCGSSRGGRGAATPRGRLKPMNGYDVLMILWGVVFAIAAVGFIAGMNQIFGSEERRQDEVASQWGYSGSEPEPVTRAA